MGDTTKYVLMLIDNKIIVHSSQIDRAAKECNIDLKVPRKGDLKSEELQDIAAILRNHV